MPKRMLDNEPLPGGLPLDKEPPISRRSILPSDFKIPDLSYLDAKEQEIPERTVFDFEYNGKKYLGEVEFVRIEQDKILSNIMAKIDFSIKNPDKEEIENKVAKFSFLLTKGPMLKEYRDSGSKENEFCGSNINYRYVEPEYGGQGFGELSMDTIKEISLKIKDKYPEWKVGFLEVYTNLPSIVKFLTDKEWLVNNNLKQYRRTGKNMGFVPDKRNEAGLIKRILEAGYSNI